MKPGQELVLLFFSLFVGFVAVIIMLLSVVLNRLPKQKRHSCTVKHTHFYAMLPEFIGGQILIRLVVSFEETGILDDIKLHRENDSLDLNFSCSWTAERKNDNRWLPHIVGRDKKYYNFFKEGTLFEIDKASIFKIGNGGFCIVMENAQGVVFLYPKSEYIIKIEDVEGYEVMLPAIAKA